MKTIKSNYKFKLKNHATSQPKHVIGEKMTTPESPKEVSGVECQQFESAHPRDQ